jgi:hypothetical protein
MKQPSHRGGTAPVHSDNADAFLPGMKRVGIVVHFGPVLCINLL